MDGAVDFRRHGRRCRRLKRSCSAQDARQSLSGLREPQRRQHGRHRRGQGRPSTSVPAASCRLSGRRPAAIADLTIPFVGKAFAMLEYQDKVGERRAGEGLDQRRFAKSGSGRRRPRWHAQGGLRRQHQGLEAIFKCLLRLVVKNQDKPRTVNARQWVAVDPRPRYGRRDQHGTWDDRDRDLQKNGVAPSRNRSRPHLNRYSAWISCS